MTDRHAGYVVTLDEKIREDDAENIIKALFMVKGVISVTPIVADLQYETAKNKVRSDLIKRLFDLIEEFSMKGK